MEEPADLSNPVTWLELASEKLNNARRIMDIGLYGDSISRA
jgi:hypothetical protein